MSKVVNQGVARRAAVGARRGWVEPRYHETPAPCAGAGARAFARVLSVAHINETRGTMKQQIKRLSPHQNGKVFGVICALGSLLFIIPMSIAMGTMGPGSARSGCAAMSVIPYPPASAVPDRFSLSLFWQLVTGCLPPAPIVGGPA